MQFETFGIYFSAKQGAELIDFYFYFSGNEKAEDFPAYSYQMARSIAYNFPPAMDHLQLSLFKGEKEQYISTYLYSNQNSIEKGQSAYCLWLNLT